ncbi:hypothetical protein [Methanolobus vulcani]|nr:hypothetical protein [Methanolobus vulcani]
MGNVFHAGFMTYLLIAVIAFVLLAMVAPNTADSILSSITDLSQAAQGIE